MKLYWKTFCNSKHFICSGDREAVIARQEFIKQLSLWDEDEDSSEEDTKQVPLPGGIEQKEIVKYF